MGRLRAQLAGEAGGVTLVELIATMVLGLLIGAAGLTAIQTSQSSSAKTTARQEAVSEAEFALRRMTQEARQATQALVSAAAPVTQLDVKTRVRPSSGAASTLRHVRYACNTSVKSCTRADCGAAVAGTLVGRPCSVTPSTVITGILGGSAFGGQLAGVDVSLATPTETPALDFVTFKLVVSLDDLASGREAVKDLDPVELTAGVDLANL